jgi:hypothetical protein
MDEVSLNKKIDKANLIIEGKVIEQTSFFNIQHDFIYTCSKVEIYKYFKGVTNAKSLYIITEGGVVGDKLLSVSPSSKPDTGNVGLFILIPSSIPFPDDNQASTYTFYSGVQGFIKYNLKTKTASEPFHIYKDIYNELYSIIIKQTGKSYNAITSFNINNFSIPSVNLRSGVAVISSFSPTLTSAGTNSIITIHGSGFGASRGSSTVGFKNADDGGKTYIEPYPNQYILWSDTQIKVKVPSTAGTGLIQIDVGSPATSNDVLVIKYAELNASADNTDEAQTAIVGLNKEGGITWRMNADVDDDKMVKESFLRALTTWKCNTLINWKLGATTLVKKTILDSINVVTFGEKGTLADGTLAVCYSYWGRCQTTSDWILQEADVVINPLANWEYGPELPTGTEYDFESVILHELGHGHQLAHVIDDTDLMNYSIRNTEVKRTLKQSNITAANDVLSRSLSGTFCGYPIATILAASNCSDIYIENADNDFLIFPNPTSGFFSIAIPNSKQNLKITLYNSSGSRLTNITTNQSFDYISLNLPEYPIGIYFLVIDTGERIVTRKIVFTR